MWSNNRRATSFFRRLGQSAWRSVPPALRSAVRILKLTLSVTLVVSYLNYAGVIAWAARLLEPLFGHLGLPGEAVSVFLTSVLVNIYAAIAVIDTIGFDYRAVVILAVMCLIAHNLIVETAIQRKTGSRAAFIVPLRIGAALIAGSGLNLILPAAMDGRLVFGGVATAIPASWSGVFMQWMVASVWLSLKMLCLIVGLNVLQSVLREFGLIDALIWPLRPAMRVFGLPRSTSFLWVVANCVGLAYGGAVMTGEIEKGEIPLRDARCASTPISPYRTACWKTRCSSPQSASGFSGCSCRGWSWPGRRCGAGGCSMPSGSNGNLQSLNFSAFSYS
ncbi:MAG: nucleoside recognition protein [Rikenellaceae bacterium]|jgi:spore maturation protein SpmB|nr:nucleoside recognition protein [Rikenellaceae bacterium]